MKRRPAPRLSALALALLACGPGSPAGPADAGRDGEPGLDAEAEPEDGGTDGSRDADEDGPLPRDGDADGDGGEPRGCWSWPIPVDALPFAYEGDTRGGACREADLYSPCAASTDESGPEVVFALEVDEPGRLRLELDDVAGDAVDLDVHLLDAPDPTACLDRHNVALERSVEPGSYWIAVDTWVDGEGVERAGPFVLRVGLEASDPGDCLTCPIDCDDSSVPSPNGVPSEVAGTGGCPPGMAAVADFCIDRYESMLVEVLGDGSLAPFSPYLPPLGHRVRALSVAGVVPQGYVDGVTAAAACAEAGKRLCTDDEWLQACRGEEGRVYPHGGATDVGECNTTRACHPAIQYFETTADWIWSELGHPCLNQLPDGLERTGGSALCVSPEGAFDLVGNLHEWTADPAGTFRGGFYVDALINGTGCLYRTTAHDVHHWDYSTGLRCCADRP